MYENLQKIKEEQAASAIDSKPVTRPQFFKLNQKKDEDALDVLLKKKPFIRIYDTIDKQLEELMEILQPQKQFNQEELNTAILTHLQGRPKWAYGSWVYYPWREELVHLSEEEDFVKIRTNRNLYKITPEERAVLADKKIGVIGLSVGQSVAMALAMERTFGELRIADFDTLDLSNMNRIRTGVSNLGLPKTLIVAREIAEIDPFLKVNCYQQGITDDNIDSFLSEEGGLDLLIEECDSLDIKIKSRQHAKKRRIPVLMDTSDRGMIDIERFDLEPDREILHGLIGRADSFSDQWQDPAQRLALSMKIAGKENLSDRLKKSVLEIGKTIRTWPQLASAVLLGGAAVAEISRRILLKENVPSGRFYIDIPKILETK